MVSDRIRVLRPTRTGRKSAWWVAPRHRLSFKKNAATEYRSSYRIARKKQRPFSLQEASNGRAHTEVANGSRVTRCNDRPFAELLDLLANRLFRDRLGRFYLRVRPGFFLRQDHLGRLRGPLAFDNVTLKLIYLFREFFNISG